MEPESKGFRIKQHVASMGLVAIKVGRNKRLGYDEDA